MILWRMTSRITKEIKQFYSLFKYYEVETKENSLGELEGDIRMALPLLQTKLLAACKFLAQGQLQFPVKIWQLQGVGSKI